MNALAQVQLAAAHAAPLVDSEYLYDPEGHLRRVQGVTPRIDDGRFVQLVAASWLHMHQREALKRGTPVPHRAGIPDWVPGTPIVNVFAIAGGHKWGKSVETSALAVWLMAVCPRIMGCVYAPSVGQARTITWRYIDKILDGAWGGDRRRLTRIRDARGGGKNSPKIELRSDRLLRTQSTDAGVKVQGQHEAVGLHIFEESEGIDDPAVYDAVRGLTADGVSLWFLCANPASSSSQFAQVSGDNVQRYNLSCLDHPNVRTGQTVVPGAVSRTWVEAQLTGRSAWALAVSTHDATRATFELAWRPGQVWAPLPPWWWRVWGVPPPTTAADACVSAAAFAAAARRDTIAIARASDPRRATLGVDCARGGEDSGYLARRWRGCVELRAPIHDRNTGAYIALVVAELEELLRGGCREVEIRVDGGGGFGSWVDELRALGGVLDLFPDGAEVVECHFGGRSYDLEAGADWATCAYIDAGDAIQELALVGACPELEEDLCSRKARWVVVSDGDEKRDVRRLERKEEFRRRFKRSPDRGDAVALACARWPQARAWEDAGAGGWRGR